MREIGIVRDRQWDGDSERVGRGECETVGVWDGENGEREWDGERVGWRE